MEWKPNSINQSFKMSSCLGLLYELRRATAQAMPLSLICLSVAISSFLSMNKGSISTPFELIRPDTSNTVKGINFGFSIFSENKLGRC